MTEADTIKNNRKKILLIDTEEKYLTATTLLLEKEGYIIKTAANYSECISTLRYEYFNLLVLTYNIPNVLNCEDEIPTIREINPYTRIILAIQKGEKAPDREFLQRFDILGYFEKSIDPGNLLLWVEAGIKAANNVELVNKSRKGLRYLLSLTSDLYKTQSREDLLQDILQQLSTIFGISDYFIAIIKEIELAVFYDTEPETFITLINEPQSTSVCTGTGKFKNKSVLSQCVSGDFHRLISDMFETRTIAGDANASLMPIRVEDQILGVVYFEHTADISISEKEMMNIFTDHAALAVQNIYLHDMALIDRESGVFINNCIDRYLLRELQFACSQPKPLTVMLVHLPDLQEIGKNAGAETYGRILKLIGSIFRSCVRLSDHIGRINDNEFMLILPDISSKNAPNLCKRIFNAINTKTIESSGGDIKLKIHIGVCGIEKTQSIAKNSGQPFYLYYKELKDTLIDKINKVMQNDTSADENAISYAEYIP